MSSIPSAGAQELQPTFFVVLVTLIFVVTAVSPRCVVYAYQFAALDLRHLCTTTDVQLSLQDPDSLDVDEQDADIAFDSAVHVVGSMSAEDLAKHHIDVLDLSDRELVLWAASRYAESKSRDAQLESVKTDPRNLYHFARPEQWVIDLFNRRAFATEFITISEVKEYANEAAYQDHLRHEELKVAIAAKYASIFQTPPSTPSRRGDDDSTSKSVVKLNLPIILVSPPHRDCVRQLRRQGQRSIGQAQADWAVELAAEMERERREAELDWLARRNTAILLGGPLAWIGWAVYKDLHADRSNITEQQRLLAERRSRM